MLNSYTGETTKMPPFFLDHFMYKINPPKLEKFPTKLCSHQGETQPIGQWFLTWESLPV